MISPRILLTRSKILTLEKGYSVARKTESLLPSCRLRWKQQRLWIDSIARDRQINLPALENQQWLIDCLEHSSVKSVCLNLNIGEKGAKLWADVCARANKQVFLRVAPANLLPEKQKKRCWQFKLMFDWLVSALLVLMLSPVMLAIALAISISSPGPILFRQWRVGKRGKLFQVFKFRTMVINAEKQHDKVMGKQKGLHKLEDDPRITPIGRWLRKYSLDELPQLFNVLRGEMSLVGPRPWALYDALRLGERGKQRLNALPGMTGAWQVEGRSQLLDLDEVTKCDLEYLNDWSLGRDLKILLMTVPKVISGFGAY